MGEPMRSLRNAGLLLAITALIDRVARGLFDHTGNDTPRSER